MSKQITDEELTAFLTDDDVPDALAAQAKQLADDPEVDLDARRRQADGWVKIYIECPDCHAPMATVGTEVYADSLPVGDTDAEDAEDGEATTFSRERTHVIGLCPACRTMKTAVQMVRLTGPPGPDFPWPEDDVFQWGERKR